MASGNSTQSFSPLVANNISDEIFDKYDNMFDLLDSFNKIENGGNIQQFLMFFSIEDTEENRKILADAFGNNPDGKGPGPHWRDSFAKQARGKKGSSGGDEDAYFITIEAMRRLTGRQASILIANFDNSVAQDSPDCWGDMILSIALIVLATVYGGPEAGAAMYAAWVVAAIQILSIVTRKPLSRNMQILVTIVSIASSWKSASTIGKTMVVANLAIQGMQYYEIDKTQKKLTRIHEETEKLKKEYAADTFEDQMKFAFSGMFQHPQRNGHEKDPQEEIKTFYNEFSVYPVNTGSVHDRIE